MATVELLFELPPLIGSPVHLVFGDDGGEPPVVDAHISGSISVVYPTVAGLVRPTVHLVGSATFTYPVLSGTVRYDSDTDRPTVNRTLSRFEDAGWVQAALKGRWQDTEHLRDSAAARYQDATGLHQSGGDRFVDSERLGLQTASSFQDAAPLHDGTHFRFQDGARIHFARAARFQEALRLRPEIRLPFQDADRRSRNWAAGRFQEAVRFLAGFTTSHQYGVSLWALVEHGRYQDAMRPPAGISWYPPDPPQPEPCYAPNPHLLFEFLFEPGNAHLLFACGEKDEPPGPPAQIIVPILRVYLVVNSAVLIRVSDGKPIPASSMSLSLDVDSWTWSFSASSPASVYADVAWQSGEPVEVQATVNGTAFRFLVENIARDRTFRTDMLRISGRGRSALLDSPYAPTMTFFNTGGLTSQQLMDWVLTDNGVPMGWDVDWNITAWGVPAGGFAHQGSYISALNRIAESAGAYIQPHNTADEIIVLARYPSGPWDWGDVEPEIELPSAVVQNEGTQWVNKPYYNRVFVSGESAGVIGQVTRTGSAGDRLAPGIVDPLITHADAARQRGLAVLSDVGRQAVVSLRLPVLPETGIIRPGNFVRYVDGGLTRIGLTRSVQVQVAMPNVWQTIAVETHDEPV